MLLYISIFVILLILYVFIGKDRQLQTLKYVLAFLALFVGISDMLGGYDRYIYGELFDQLALDRRAGNTLLSPIIFTYASEWAYVALNYIISLFTVNRYIFILVVTCIIYVFLYYAIKRYTSDYLFAVILFMGLWFFFSFTYLRQILAAVVGWMSIKYAIERKPWRFLAVVIVAYGFHNSAIMLLPLYLIPMRQLSKNNVVLFLILSTALGFTPIASNFFETYMSYSGQEERLAQTIGQSVGFLGVRWEYILEATVFVWFIFRSYYLYDQNDKRAMFMRNMALVFCAILLVFIRSENGGRLSWYYMIGVIATMSDIVSKSRNNIIKVELITLSAALFLRIIIAWGPMLSPYKTFFTSGHRKFDYIYDLYEYDYKYDHDKFYKL